MGSLVQQASCQLVLNKAPGAPATGTSTASQIAGRKRRRNRWSDAPPTVSDDSAAAMSSGDATIAAAIASLRSNPITAGGQQHQVGSGGHLTPEQLRQVKEQIEVSLCPGQ